MGIDLSQVHDTENKWLWKTKEATANLRTPAILRLGACCSAFAGCKNQKKGSRELDRLHDAFKTAARLRGQNNDAEPRFTAIEDPWDLNLGDPYDDLLGPVSQRSSLFNLRPVTSTSSSEAGSLTLTRVLRSSTRATMTSPTKSAASASSCESLSAGPQGSDYAKLLAGITTQCIRISST